jgi:hypothetical protein
MRKNPNNNRDNVPHVEIFWIVTPCSNAVYHRFRCPCYLHLQGEHHTASQLKKLDLKFHRHENLKYFISGIRFKLLHRNMPSPHTLHILTLIQNKWMSYIISFYCKECSYHSSDFSLPIQCSCGPSRGGLHAWVTTMVSLFGQN